MSERVALYARVSTARQEQEQPVVSQLDALRQAAQVLGLSVTADHEYVDDGFSGARLDRPGLDRLRDAAADGLIDVARSYVHQQVVLEELEKRGVRVHFIVETQSAGGRVLASDLVVSEAYFSARDRPDAPRRFWSRSRRGARRERWAEAGLEKAHEQMGAGGRRAELGSRCTGNGKARSGPRSFAINPSRR